MRKTGCFAAATVFLVLFSAFFITCTAKSQSREEIGREEADFLQLERAYVQEMREYLNESGFSDSGVMLTRTVYEDGSREYRITIHNSRFDRLTGEERDTLIWELEQRAFQGGERQLHFTHYLTGSA